MPNVGKPLHREDSVASADGPDTAAGVTVQPDPAAVPGWLVGGGDITQAERRLARNGVSLDTIAARFAGTEPAQLTTTSQASRGPQPSRKNRTKRRH